MTEFKNYKTPLIRTSYSRISPYKINSKVVATILGLSLFSFSAFSTPKDCRELVGNIRESHEEKDLRKSERLKVLIPLSIPVVGAVLIGVGVGLNALVKHRPVQWNPSYLNSTVLNAPATPSSPELIVKGDGTVSVKLAQNSVKEIHLDPVLPVSSRSSFLEKSGVKVFESVDGSRTLFMTTSHFNPTEKLNKIVLNIVRIEKGEPAIVYSSNEMQQIDQPLGRIPIPALGALGSLVDFHAADVSNFKVLQLSDESFIVALDATNYDSDPKSLLIKFSKDFQPIAKSEINISADDLKLQKVKGEDRIYIFGPTHYNGADVDRREDSALGQLDSNLKVVNRVELGGMWNRDRIWVDENGVAVVCVGLDGFRGDRIYEIDSQGKVLKTFSEAEANDVYNIDSSGILMRKIH